MDALWNLGKKSGQRNGLNLSKDPFFFDIHLSHLVFITLATRLPLPPPPPFENPSYATEMTKK